MMLKFIFIVACFVIAATSYFFCQSKKDWAWLIAGLLFTVGADYFLVIQNHHLMGVAVFCFAHVCYILRGLNSEKHKQKMALVVAPFLTMAIVIAFANGAIFVLAGIYATLFSLNIAVNLKFCKINKPIVLTGLILFALCDVNVLLFNSPHQLGIPVVFPFAFQLIWVFYLPSQLLLAVSGVRFRRRT